MERSDIAVPKVIPFSSCVVMPPSSVVNGEEAVALFPHSDLDFLLQLDPFLSIRRPRPFQFHV
jgi:hypothetical protein